jgi:intracellular sulfur oxidation DsrE/DsrF family protein
MKRRQSLVIIVAAVLFAIPAAQAKDVKKGTDVPAINVDVPVKLSSASIVFNLDHLAFGGDMPIGIKYMDLLHKRYVEWKTKGKIVGVFHGPAAYMTLNDRAYNANRRDSTGNPYKELIASLIREGVEIEECAFSMQTNGWGNADLLPGVKVNTGAIARITELVQQGYVQIQP